MDKKKRKYLYVLLLEGDNYYIGQTDDLVRRFRQHSEGIGEGAMWTYYNKPIRIIEEWDLGEYTEDGALQFENELTIRYINKYGVDRVRGGQFVYTDLERNLGWIESRTYIEDDKFILKSNNDSKRIFASIKSELENVIIEGSSYIYVLGLMDNCIYVNKSSRLIKDLHRHFFAKGSLWTSIHRPIKLIECVENQDLGKFNGIPFQNSFVRKYIEINGWQNVRGGDYKIIDEKEHYRLLKKKMPDLVK